LAAHALDYDDSLTTLRGHPTAPMLGAGLAVGEAANASGKAVLAAIALGLEVGGKLGPALGAGDDNAEGRVGEVEVFGGGAGVGQEIGRAHV